MHFLKSATDMQIKVVGAYGFLANDCNCINEYVLFLLSVKFILI